MLCPDCDGVIETPEDQVHVVRTCPKCGREYRAACPGDHGIGVQVKAGERFVIPSGWLQFSFNPLKARGQLTKSGVDWLANMVFLDEIQKHKKDVIEVLRNQEDRYDYILRQSKLLEGLDITNNEDGEKIWEILLNNKESIEWWANLTGMLAKMAREAMESGNMEEAVWAASFSERSRAMLLFKEHMEEVVWMGVSAKRLVDIIQTWDSNKSNGDEGFWQLTLNQNTYALSQIFAVPLLFIKNEAYVGGMNIDRHDAKLVDYLFAMESSKDSVLIEIKTPITKLLGTKYRGTYRPSAELSGALMQALDYRRTILEDIASVTRGSSHEIKAFNPKCAIIIGNGKAELNTEDKRRAFEAYRSNSINVEIITYDELFRKLEIMANLFNLSRSAQA